MQLIWIFMFIDVLMQILKYAKFLKEAFSNKRKLDNISLVLLNEEWSAILNLKKKLP